MQVQRCLGRVGDRNKPTKLNSVCIGKARRAIAKIQENAENVTPQKVPSPPKFLPKNVQRDEFLLLMLIA